MALRNGLRNAILVFSFVLLSSGYLITMIPAGATYQVEAKVESRTSRSGATGNIGVLICVLANGHRVTISVPPVATVQTGDTVVLNSHDRYILSPRYSFAGKLISKG